MCYETCPQHRGQRHQEGDREETERAGGGDERWIVVFVGQCVTAAAAEEEVEEAT